MLLAHDSDAYTIEAILELGQHNNPPERRSKWKDTDTAALLEEL